MCSLTFFPRILQNEAFRAPSKLRRFQMLDLRKAKTITKGHPKYIYDGYHKIGTDVRKFYHHAANLPKPDKDGNIKTPLLEKCKIFAVSIYEQIISKILKGKKTVSATCHQDLGEVLRNTRSDVGFAATDVCPDAKYQNRGMTLKPNLSDFALFAKDESVFKDVLARFPLDLPPKNIRLQYRDKKVENTYNKKKKDYADTTADVNTEYDHNPRRHTRRRVTRGEVRTSPIGAQNLSSWVTMDRTTEAMLNFMKNTDRCQDVRCVRRVRLQMPDTGARVSEQMGKRPPPCFPPLRPPPPLQPPPAPMPPLPACPKPRPSK